MNQKVSAVTSEEIVNYWNGRARTYNNCVKGELADERRTAWEHVLKPHAAAALAHAECEGRAPRAIDLGCGPGFFGILFAEQGFQVTAVDASPNMIARARENVSAASLDNMVDFHLGDVAVLPYADNSFDIALLRNVTWHMRDPEGAYREWIRVLRPGGKLLVFDSNWYLYLSDSKIDEMRRANQDNAVLKNWDEDAHASTQEDRVCEEMATRLPLSYVQRPQWDLEFLGGLGLSAVRAGEDVWKTLWTDDEKAFYASSPMFLVEVIK